MHNTAHPPAVGTREEVPEMVPRGFKASEKSNSRVNKQD